MHQSPEILSPEADVEKRADERVHEFEQEAREFKKVFSEFRASSTFSPQEAEKFEQDLQADVAGFNLRIRKNQRDKETYLGAEPRGREERSKKLDMLIFTEIPPQAYISYLEQRVSSLSKYYEQVKKEYDALKKEKEDFFAQAADAHEKKDTAGEQKFSEKARAKECEMKEKLSIIQNDIGASLHPGVEVEIRYVEKIISALPKNEQGEMSARIAALRMTMYELQSKTQKDRVSSEDLDSDYFSKKHI
ncbi:hypothetical protein HYW94_02465 [Candidatus Uhrbacteria bacterium]|nr:hypothetical protein [Candidatus Uhrbacteria bacterium]